MVHPTKLNLVKPSKFLEVTDAFTEDMMEAYLAKHMEKVNYGIGVENVDQLSQDEFASIRSYTFGASDSSVIMEVAYSSKKVPMKTKDDLLFEKINKEWDESIGLKASVRKGRELEPLIIDKITNLIEGVVLKPKHMYVSLDNEEGLATNFDGVVFEAIETNNELTDVFQPVPMEIKVCSFFGRSNYNWHKAVSEFEDNVVEKITAPKKLGTPPNANYQEHIIKMSDILGIPKYYYTQLQQQMEFLDAQHGYLAVMDDIDWTLYFYRVPRDQHVIDELKRRAKELNAQLMQHIVEEEKQKHM